MKALVAARGIPVLYLRYQDCINNPTIEASKINVFLGEHLDESAMVNVVDKSLYRNRKEDFHVP